MHTHPNQAPYTTTLPLEGARFIGYVRVSTEKQAENGDLEGQEERIRRFCKMRGYILVAIYVETCSAADEKNLQKREELNQALIHANSEKVPILVTDVSRLSRRTKDLAQIAEKSPLKILSIQDECFLDVRSLAPLIDKAAETAAAISSGTTRALSALRQSGKKLGSPADNRKPAKASAKVRSQRKVEIIDRIADLLSSNPDYQSLTNRELAEILNREGILSGHNRPWNANSLRQRMKKVKEELRQRVELQAALDEEDRQEMKKLPHYGMFQID